ncbi:MAG: hypothetical protein HY075_10330 [Deltaproteobacteria bacterium]|nr:hypothetical protein [Deltaproteobacteria bacterium]
MKLQHIGVILVLGMVLGFGLATLTGRTEKRIVRRDAVTIERRDLAHVLNAIQLIRDTPAGRSYTRYEAGSGRVAFECPNARACNLEMPSQPRANAPEVQVTLVGEKTETIAQPVTVPTPQPAPTAPVEAVTQPVEAVSAVHK